MYKDKISTIKICESDTPGKKLTINRNFNLKLSLISIKYKD